MKDSDWQDVGKACVLAAAVIALYGMAVFSFLFLAKAGKPATLNDLVSMAFIVEGALVLFGAGTWAINSDLMEG